MTMLMTKQCDHLAEVLPGVLDDQNLLSTEDAAHLGQCLRCQAELSRYRRLERTLRGLRDFAVSVPSGLLDELLEGLDSATERRERHRIAGRRAASLVGLAAATAAGVGGVLVLATRRRSA
jgi:hypothetical protein